MPRESKLPQRLQPMLAVLTDAPFDDAGWVFESKWDGFRMVTSIAGGKVALFSRNGKIISESYRVVARALEKIKHDVVLDGELVALDSHGRARFQLLQNALRSQANLRYYLFDLMFLDGADVRGLSLLERKEKLRRLIPKHPLLAFTAHRAEHGTKYFKQAQRQGLEGIMAKRAASPYLSGQRSGDWLKVKTARRQEVVIAGFTAPRRTRPYFGSLVLAVRQDDGWRYIGHVGTGFTHATLRDLYQRLWPLRRGRSPFKEHVKNEAATTWVKPQLVAEVKFTEWTSAGEMRHPAFLGLREDKAAKDVLKEKETSRKAR
ncbi:MAG TPA: non-homologous end-joining DNA ligase [Hyphomicrobiaceae bacterium]|jgi:bifunctional non-homologous end joining protein LigD